MGKCVHGVNPYSKEHTLRMTRLALANLKHVRSHSKYLEAARLILDDILERGIVDDPEDHRLHYTETEPEVCDFFVGPD